MNLYEQQENLSRQPGSKKGLIPEAKTVIYQNNKSGLTSIEHTGTHSQMISPHFAHDEIVSKRYSGHDELSAPGQIPEASSPQTAGFDKDKLGLATERTKKKATDQSQMNTDEAGLQTRKHLDLACTLETQARQFLNNNEEYQQLKKMQVQLDLEGQEVRQQILESLRQSIEPPDAKSSQTPQQRLLIQVADGGQLGVVGTAANQHIRINGSLSGASRESQNTQFTQSYAHILKMMKNMEEYGKNLEKQQSLTLQEHLQRAHGISLDSQANSPGRNFLLTVGEKVFLPKRLRMPLQRKQRPGRNTTCLYDKKQAKTAEAIDGDFDDGASTAQEMNNFSLDRIHQRQLKTSLGFLSPNYISNQKYGGSESSPFRNNSKDYGRCNHCYGCQQILMKQQVEYIKQKKKYIENLKQLTDLSKNLRAVRAASNDDADQTQLLNDQIQSILTNSNDEIISPDIKAVFKRLNAEQGQVEMISSAVRNEKLVSRVTNKHSKFTKYRVINGKVYEALQPKEHQFTGSMSNKFLLSPKSKSNNQSRENSQDPIKSDNHIKVVSAFSGMSQQNLNPNPQQIMMNKTASSELKGMNHFGMDIQIKNDLNEFQKYNYSMKYTAGLGASQKTSNIVTLEKQQTVFMDDYRKASEDALRQSRHRNQNTDNNTTLDVRADEPNQVMSKPPSLGKPQLSSKSNRNHDGFQRIASPRQTRFRDNTQKLTIQEYARDGFEHQLDGNDFNKKRPLTSKGNNLNKRYLLRRQQSRRQESVKATTSNSHHHPYRPKLPPSQNTMHSQQRQLNAKDPNSHHQLIAALNMIGSGIHVPLAAQSLMLKKKQNFSRTEYNPIASLGVTGQKAVKSVSQKLGKKFRNNRPSSRLDENMEIIQQDQMLKNEHGEVMLEDATPAASSQNQRRSIQKTQPNEQSAAGSSMAHFKQQNINKKGGFSLQGKSNMSQGHTVNHTAMGGSETQERAGAASKSSLRRQISLSKIEKKDGAPAEEGQGQTIDELDDIDLMEDTFVREPLNIDQQHDNINITERGEFTKVSHTVMEEMQSMSPVSPTKTLYIDQPRKLASIDKRRSTEARKGEEGPILNMQNAPTEAAKILITENDQGSEINNNGPYIVFNGDVQRAGMFRTQENQNKTSKSQNPTSLQSKPLTQGGSATNGTRFVSYRQSSTRRDGEEQNAENLQTLQTQNQAPSQNVQTPLTLFENQYINTPQILIKEPVRSSYGSNNFKTQQTVNSLNSHRQGQLLLRQYRKKERSNRVDMLKNIKNSKLPNKEQLHAQKQSKSLKSRQVVRQKPIQSSTIIREQLKYINNKKQIEPEDIVRMPIKKNHIVVPVYRDVRESKGSNGVDLQQSDTFQSLMNNDIYRHYKNLNPQEQTNSGDYGVGTFQDQTDQNATRSVQQTPIVQGSPLRNPSVKESGEYQPGGTYMQMVSVGVSANDFMPPTDGSVIFSGQYANVQQPAAGSILTEKRDYHNQQINIPNNIHYQNQIKINQDGAGTLSPSARINRIQNYALQYARSYVSPNSNTTNVPIDFNLTRSQQEKTMDDLVLSNVTADATGVQNDIQQILDQKQQLKLIRAADANYMNEAVFNKFAKTWVQREGIITNPDEVVHKYRQKINKLYEAVQNHFVARSQVEKFGQQIQIPTGLVGMSDGSQSYLDNSSQQPIHPMNTSAVNGHVSFQSLEHPAMAALMMPTHSNPGDTLVPQTMTVIRNDISGEGNLTSYHEEPFKQWQQAPAPQGRDTTPLERNLTTQQIQSSVHENSNSNAKAATPALKRISAQSGHKTEQSRGRKSHQGPTKMAGDGPGAPGSVHKALQKSLEQSPKRKHDWQVQIKHSKPHMKEREAPFEYNLDGQRISPEMREEQRQLAKTRLRTPVYPDSMGARKVTQTPVLKPLQGITTGAMRYDPQIINQGNLVITVQETQPDLAQGFAPMTYIPSHIPSLGGDGVDVALSPMSDGKVTINNPTVLMSPQDNQMDNL